jgi:Protein of unknown function (DUF2934)
VLLVLEEAVMTTATTSNPGQRKTPPAVTPATPGAVDAPIAAATLAVSRRIEPERRYAMIRDAAYFLSERRGFCTGHELDDWLTAEAEADRALTSGDLAMPGGS